MSMVCSVSDFLGLSAIVNAVTVIFPSDVSEPHRATWCTTIETEYGPWNMRQENTERGAQSEHTQKKAELKQKHTALVDMIDCSLI